ncbi:MAG: zinc ribbon domain-containing protein [Verrucomicrobiota bacterium]|nr:zinc ribbon domain-containing protein [Verrucomicrobiota bacterium]
MTATLTVKLACPECRRENEAERIYCHDCGARLDRSALAKVKSKEEDPQVTRRRLQGMFDARRARLHRMFFNGAKLILGALFIAALVQMLRSADMPAAKLSPDSFPPQISLDLSNAEMDARVGPLTYSESQVNAYLASALKSKRSTLSKYLNFDGAAVQFEEGKCRATVQRSLYGWPLSTSVVFAPTVQNGAMRAKCLGGAIGRLPIHPMLMQASDLLFADVRGVVERERKSIAKLGGLELHPQTIVISRRAAQP